VRPLTLRAEKKNRPRNKLLLKIPVENYEQLHTSRPMNMVAKQPITIPMTPASPND
jgi:hypothetical protein